MQKITKKASILIWSIFLSLIISISFLSISTKITKNLQNSTNLNKNLKENNKIQNILKSSQNNTESIWNTNIYIENSKLQKTLKNTEIYTILFPNQSEISLELKNNWIIFYNTWWTNTWILSWSNTVIETIINSGNSLTLENFSWYSKFELISKNKFVIPVKNYKIIKEIWNKEVIKSFWQIK